MSFPQKGGWHYVVVPRSINTELADHADLGDKQWDASMMPIGDGTPFIALNHAVRMTNDLHVGDTTTIDFMLRTR